MRRTRLDKLLSENGLSRKQAGQVIRAGRVKVDGEVVRDAAHALDADTARVTLDGEALSTEKHLHLMLNKPAGFVTATEDRQEKTVMELLPENLRHMDLKPVGRLDKETEGLLLFTNDGALLHRLIAPKKRVEKEYYARHEGQATPEDVAAFEKGLTLADGTVCLPAVLMPLGPGESLVTVVEGKYHQVRRMLASRGMRVTYLERRREGGLTLGALPRGTVRELTDEELGELEDGCQ